MGYGPAYAAEQKKGGCPQSLDNGVLTQPKPQTQAPKTMDEEPDFIVSINFTAAGREWLGLKSGPPSEYPEPPDLLHLRWVVAGDFLRIEGIAGQWVVSHRTWHLMHDQRHLKLVLDGPIAEDD